MAGFDRSFLPEAQGEVGIIGDTHFIQDVKAYAIEFDSVRQWPARAERALEQLATLGAKSVVHLGDLSEEPPGHPDHEASRKAGLQVMQDLGVQPHFVAGNMDIGDKPDPTMWTPPVQPETLQWFHDQFGPSWKSWDEGPGHFVLLNSQILNANLPEAQEQQKWLEEDLATYSEKRLFVFLHMPPFFVSEEEPDTGFYNSIDEPARSWFCQLCREYQVEAVFCGHTHFRAFNRIGKTRFYVCASTTTSRAGFYEAFSVVPAPEGGRNDPPKLGFGLLRILKEGHRFHFIRTGGATEKSNGEWAELLTRHSRDCPVSPLGLFLRLPLAVDAPGALAWPGVKRQRVRDDHPFLHAVEMGCRHVRFPADDLKNPLLSDRLNLLREEDVSLTGIWVEAPRLDLAKELASLPVQPDVVEVHLPGQVFPEEALFNKLSQAWTVFSGAFSLAPYLPRERTPGHYHPRGRLGYSLSELESLNELVEKFELESIRVLGTLPADADLLEILDEYAVAIQSMPGVSGVDLILPLPDSEAVWGAVLARALSAAFQVQGIRLFLDPYIDLDRTNDYRPGILDRLGNPKPVYHTVRSLNTLLSAASKPEDWMILERLSQWELYLSQGAPASRLKIVSLPRCASRELSLREAQSELGEEDFPIALAANGLPEF